MNAEITNDIPESWVLGFLVLLFVILLGVAATQFEIGSIAFGDRSDCDSGYYTPTHPDTEEPYTSLDDLREDVIAASPEWNQTQIEDYMSSAELRNTENGTIVQLQEGCQ